MWYIRNMTAKKNLPFTVFCRDDRHSEKIGEQIVADLTRNGWVFEPEQPELVICVGGDGTILRAIHHYYSLLERTYFVGVHTGTLGFLTDYTDEMLDQFLQDLKTKEFKEETLTMIDIKLSTGETYHALNEVRIGDFVCSVKYDIYIDGEFFEQTNGSGICIATQAGSTAISRALMGAVVDNGLDIFQLCEIMPASHKGFHSLRNPYIMNSKRVIRIESRDFDRSTMSYDHLSCTLEGVTSMEICASPKKIRFARYRPYSYLTRLKNLY